MNRSFTFEEFKRSLKGPPRGPLEPRIISFKLPQTSASTNFRPSASLLGLGHYPSDWQEVTLHLIQKRLDLPSNFHPISLMEILRKVWTKMTTTRIIPSIQKYSVLQNNHYGFLPGRGTSSELIQLLNVLEEVVENELEVDLTAADAKGAF